MNNEPQEYNTLPKVDFQNKIEIKIDLIELELICSALETKRNSAKWKFEKATLKSKEYFKSEMVAYSKLYNKLRKKNKY